MWNQYREAEIRWEQEQFKTLLKKYTWETKNVIHVDSIVNESIFYCYWRTAKTDKIRIFNRRFNMVFKLSELSYMNKRGLEFEIEEFKKYCERRENEKS